MDSHQEHNFRRQVDASLETVRRLLDNSRNPVYAADVHHAYDDKFTIAEFLVRSAVCCNFQTLSELGIPSELLCKLENWSRKQMVTLRFQAEEKCTFDREEKKKVDSDEKNVTTIGVGSLSGTFTSKVVTVVHQFFWTIEVTYRLVAFRGVGYKDEDRHTVFTQTNRKQIFTSSKVAPMTTHMAYPPLDVDISWLLQHIDPETLSPKFSIQRELNSCRTPRRNEDIDEALCSHRKLSTWSCSVLEYFRRQLSLWPDGNVPTISADSVFVPVLPLLEGAGAGDSTNSLESSDTQAVDNDASNASTAPAETNSVALTSSDLRLFCSEQLRSLRCAIESVGREFGLPTSAASTGVGGALVTAREAGLIVCLTHLRDVEYRLVDGVDCLEDMLRKQLYAAIGRIVNAHDFAACMRFHNRERFAADFRPRPFSYAVRRTMRHSPEGQLSIEERYADGSISEPVYTVVRRAGPGVTQDMQFSLSAATTVRLGGERYLHAWMRQGFSEPSTPSAQIFLSAQARQFSSFIVLVGTVVSATVFEPKYGMIVQNKDEFKVPLVLDTIPSAREFRDAIESLSPEQQEFARAFRSMQLAGTLFGVCVIQIKPQLERLLNLPPESLTKEIKLTQHLMELFIKYQIPSDLLTAGVIGDAGGGGGGDDSGQPKPPEEVSQAGRDMSRGAAVDRAVMPGVNQSPSEEDKVAEVKRHVAAMLELVAAAKDKELKEAEEEAMYAEMRRRAQAGAEEQARATELLRSGEFFEGLCELKSQNLQLLCELKSQDLQLDALDFKCDTYALKKSRSRVPSLTNMFRKVMPRSMSAGGGSASAASAKCSESAAARSVGAKLRGEGCAPPPAQMALQVHLCMSSAETTVVKNSPAGGLAVDQPPRNSSAETLKPPTNNDAAAPAAAEPSPAAKKPFSDDKEPDAHWQDEGRDSDGSRAGGAAAPATAVADYTKLPGELDRMLEALDGGGAVRPTTIRPGEEWSKRSVASLLSAGPAAEVTVRAEGQRGERARAFELLDALTRGGAVRVEEASVHVVLAATHMFDKGLVDTVVEDGVNPVDKLERSTLIMASAVLQQPVAALVRDEHVPRLRGLHPALFE